MQGKALKSGGCRKAASKPIYSTEHQSQPSGWNTHWHMQTQCCSRIYQDMECTTARVRRRQLVHIRILRAGLCVCSSIGEHSEPLELLQWDLKQRIVRMQERDVRARPQSFKWCASNSCLPHSPHCKAMNYCVNSSKSPHSLPFSLMPSARYRDDRKFKSSFLFCKQGREIPCNLCFP